MSAALRQPMTLEQFLAWEERQELKFEFDGVGPVAMTSGTAAHAGIQRNLIYALTRRLLDSHCQAYGSDLKIEVAGRIRYPEAFIVCTPVPARSTVVRDPVVIFEVVSESSVTIDFVVKNAEYRAAPSVLRYIVLQQTRAAAAVFSRKGDDWMTELLVGEETVFADAGDRDRGAACGNLSAGGVRGGPGRMSVSSWGVAVPNVFVADFEAALAYYTGPLGFRALFVYGDVPFYAQVKRDAAVLALRQVTKPVIDRTAGEALLSAFVEVADVEAVHVSLVEAGARIWQGPRDEPWGMRSIIMGDLDGNLICFASALER